jgi:hypothetical protein
LTKQTHARLSRAPSQIADATSWLAYEVGRINLDKISTLRADVYDHDAAGPHVELRVYDGPPGRTGRPTEKVVRLSFEQVPHLRALLQRALAKAAHYQLCDGDGGPAPRGNRPLAPDSDAPVGRAASIAGRLGD